MITVQRQLAIIVLVTISVVVVLMTGTFFVIEYVSYRRIAVESAYPQGESLGINLRAALTTRDPHTAREILATLLADSTVEGVYLFDQKDLPFSFVQRQIAYGDEPIVDRPENLLDRLTIQAILATGEKSSRFVKGCLAAFIPIHQDGRKIGTVYIVSNLAPLERRLWWWGLCALPLVAVASGIGVTLSARLQRKISGPLEQLTDAMRMVSKRQDFSIRADIRSRTDEISALVDGFNDMLGHISARDQELAEINATLEERVRQRTEELRNSENKYRTLFEESPISLWEQDFSSVKETLDGLRRQGTGELAEYLYEHPEEIKRCMGLARIIDVNQRTIELFRGGSKEVLCAQIDRLCTPLTLEKSVNGLVALSEGRRRHSMEIEGRTFSGEPIICSVHWAVMPGHEASYDRVVVSLEDITERRRIQERLQISLQEKEILLREVHHRVKNNLQVVASLLGLQMKKSSEPAIIEALRVSLTRVRTISLIHEKLYARESAPLVELGSYLSELAHDIFQLHNIYGPRVELKIDVVQVETNLDVLMAMALIVNELLTNALKYGFTDGRSGVVTMKLWQDANGLGLSVADNGVGLPPGLTWETTSSLGLRLVNNLSRQIGGVVELSCSGGTCVTLRCAPSRSEY